jgi:hypothetical protein
MKEEPAGPSGLDGSLVPSHYTTKMLVALRGIAESPLRWAQNPLSQHPHVLE